MLTFLSQVIIPLMVFSIVGTGLLKKVNIFDEFIKGAGDGLQTVVKLVPALIGLIVGVGVLRESGLLDFLCEKIAFLTEIFGFPSALVPLAVVRLFSASAANGLLFDIFKNYGTDSFIGFAASIMLSSTETVLYCVSIYFGATKVTKTGWTLAGGLLCSAVGIAASVFLAG